MNKLVAGNWKMFKGPAETAAFFDAFQPPGGVDVIVCPPYVSLSAAVGRGVPVYAQSVHWAAEGSEGVPDPRLADLGRRWLGPENGAGGAGWLRHRLSLGVTEGAAELGSDKILWLECNAIELNGVSFDKGCYVGQENTARMNWRNKVNRRLVVVPADAPGPRTRVHYPELGLAVEHRRVDDLGGAIVPDWLAPALSP